jgi:putative polymerase
MKLKILTSDGVGIPGLLLMAAVFYNSFLAVINAHAMHLNQGYVSITEIFIVLLAMCFAGMKITFLPNIRPVLLYSLFMALALLFVAIVNEYIYLKSFRDILLIVVFFVVGGLAGDKNLFLTFRYICAVVLFFMLIENYLTGFYVALFEPSSYFANTRGIEEFSIDESGLFRNALGYQGRFSFGFLSDHRLSSIFLEQVSLANFSMVLAIFTSTFWEKLSKNDRIFYILTIAFIVLSNSTRTGTGVCLLILFGYFIFPYLPRYSNLLYMPVIIIIAVLAFYNPNYASMAHTDDLAGRIGTTLYLLESIWPYFFTGGPLNLISRTADSGYAYIILSQSIFGLIAFWLFSCLIVPQRDENNRRFAHGSSLYLFLNLMIGAAIFSIKVSAPFWFIAGYLYYRPYAQSSNGLLYNGKR